MNKSFRPNPVIVSSPEEGNIMEVNRSFSDNNGVSPEEEVVAKKVKQINLWKHPTHKEKLLERKQQPGALRKTKKNSVALVGPANERSKIALPMGDGLIFIKVSEIVYLKASGNYTEIHLINKTKHLVSRLLQEFESLLVDHNFFRIHHSTLVQLYHIERYAKSEGGYLIMADNSQLVISRRKREAFLARIGYKDRIES